MKIKYGTVLCDMHNGLELPKGAEVVTKIVVECHVGSTVIEDSVRRMTGDEFWGYTNKFLVVTGEDWNSGHTQAMYSYDGRRLSILEISGLH
jgi:hypothetical protein